MEIIIINGFNFNFLGKWELEIYGEDFFEDFLLYLCGLFLEVSFYYFQLNLEGVLIDKFYELGFSYDGIIFNVGVYMYILIVLVDVIVGIDILVIEVYIFNVYVCEVFCYYFYLLVYCEGVIVGFGLRGYELVV